MNISKEIKSPTKSDDLLREIEEFIKDGTGKELTEEYKEFLEKKRKYMHGKSPWEEPPSSPKIKGYTIEELCDIYQKLNENRMHPFNGFFCLSPCCLYPYYKLIHKRSKLRKDYFFLAWLLILTGDLRKGNSEKYFNYNQKFAKDLIFEVILENRPIKYNLKLAEDLMFKITLKNLPWIANKKRIYQILKRYKKIISSTIWCKLWLFYKGSQNIRLMFAQEYYRKVEKPTERYVKLAEKIIRDVKKEKEVTQRQLEIRYSKKIGELDFLLRLFDSQPDFLWDIKKKKLIYLGKDISR